MLAEKNRTAAVFPQTMNVHGCTVFSKYKITCMYVYYVLNILIVNNCCSPFNLTFVQLQQMA